jgi:methylenetetrahydrofolate reductase (NADPH)
MRIDEIIASTHPCFSVEFFPPKTEEGRQQLYETMRVLRDLQPAFVSVTYGAGGATREGTVEVARALQSEHGVETMAHLSCVGETVEGVRAVLDRIQEAGIENVLALRGDPPRGEVEFVPPEGGLTSSPELAAIISENYPFAIGAACFPEVHPEAPSLDADLDFLKRKLEAGATFLITQLFFESQLYFDFVAAARAKGIEAPIIAGLMPITSYAQIRRFCEICQATIPEPLAEAMDALGGDQQAEFELGVAYAAQQAGELLRGDCPGIHFYSLNKWPATRAILGALRAAKPWERAGQEPAGTPA